MKRCLLLLAVLAVASGLSAQGNNKYTQEDVLAVFAQYNPAVLEEAKGNASYNEIVQALANSFQRVKTPENEAELLAVVKNFDNSLRLFLIAQAYEEGLALQQASNIDLASLDKTTQQDLLEVFQSIYNTTLQIRDEEIKLCKKRISGGGGQGGAGPLWPREKAAGVLPDPGGHRLPDRHRPYLYGGGGAGTGRRAPGRFHPGGDPGQRRRAEPAD